MEKASNMNDLIDVKLVPTKKTIEEMKIVMKKKNEENYIIRKIKEFLRYFN